MYNFFHVYEQMSQKVQKLDMLDMLNKKDPSICSGVDKIPDLFQIS